MKIISAGLLLLVLFVSAFCAEKITETGKIEKS